VVLEPAVLVGLINFVIVRGTHVYPELAKKREEGRKVLELTLFAYDSDMA
jgi:hypothetical protein